MEDLDCYCGDSASKFRGRKCPTRNYNTWPDREFYRCPRNSAKNMMSPARVGIEQQPETD